MSSESGFGVRVERLGKRFRITPPGVAGTRGWPFRPRRVPLWALREISFEVPRGSTLGVIGRNGAGKTTLLKVLSRITPPTEGRAIMAGRASSLIEVGTGFHQELTGRENVFLNGAILGMRRAEIRRKFDEIVDFSEIGQFIDTPVKRYSSGMNLRLAFSVAAHLEPDVLLVDEVLAVGDASFQKKCLGKMDEVTGEGRTVVLVSHSMPTIASLAERTIWIDGGSIVAEGPTSEVIEKYMKGAVGAYDGGEADLSQRKRAPGHEESVRLRTVRLKDVAGEARSTFFEGDPIRIEVDVDVSADANLLESRAYIRTIEGHWLFSALSGKSAVELRPGRVRLATTIEPNHLRPGEYTIDLGIQTGLPQDFLSDAIGFTVEPTPHGYSDPVLRSHVGSLRFDLPWEPPVPLDDDTE